MAPPKTDTSSNAAATAAKLRSQSKKTNRAWNLSLRFYTKYVNYEYLKYVIFDPAALPFVSVLILIAEMVLNVLVVNRVPYTEIDWVAYMQECEGFLNGTTNYALLKGDTGPLVYPAGFVYIYSALYFITSHGRNVRLAQYIFIVFYLLQMWLVLRLYTKSRKVPPYVLAISAFTSYRIHSIYVLRLFNDPLAVLFLYAALNLFMDHRWSWGSFCFSLAVGIKMNILLFAPALLFFYLINLGYWRTFVQLSICAGLQLLLGAPFLLTYPLAYLKGSFDLGRIFEHKWTVNYRFLPRELFEHKVFHVLLLVLHLLLLAACVKPAYVYFTNYNRLRQLQMQLQPQIKRKNEEIRNAAKKPKRPAPKPVESNAEDETLTPDQEAFLKSFEKGIQRQTGLKAPIAPPPVKEEEPEDENAEVSIHFDQCTQLALLPFFVCNFIGVMCARSLHYQFYVWYFHSLPHLAWSTPYSLPLRYLILGLIEFCWNTYPSTYYSSIMLHICHLVLLGGVMRNMFKTMRQSLIIPTLEEPKSKTN